MKRLSLSAARETMDGIADVAEKEDGVLLLNKAEEPIAVLLSIDHYRSLMGFLDLASDPDQLKESMAKYDRIRKGNIEGFVPLELKSFR